MHTIRHIRHIAAFAATTGFWFSAEAPAAVMHSLSSHQEVSELNQFNHSDPHGFGAAGTNGPVMANFNAHQSRNGVGKPDLADVIANPPGFYANLHNADFPKRAISGQYCDPPPVYSTPLPAAAWLFGSGLLGLLGIARRRARSDHQSLSSSP